MAVDIRQRRTKSKCDTHVLINGARKHFESGRDLGDREIYLKPYKKLLVDITTSKSALVEALEIANELFNALEARGFRVAIAPQTVELRRPEIDWHETPKKPQVYYPTVWKPSRPTVVYVGDVAMGIALLEMAEPVLMRSLGSGKYIRDSEYVAPKLRRGERDWSWTSTRDLPTGRFRLQLYSAYHHEVRRQIARGQERIRKRKRVKAWLKSLGVSLGQVRDAEEALFQRGRFRRKASRSMEF